MPGHSDGSLHVHSLLYAQCQFLRLHLAATFFFGSLSCRAPVLDSNDFQSSPVIGMLFTTVLDQRGWLLHKYLML